MKRKILSLVLLFALCWGIIPNARAAEEIKVAPTDEEFIALLPQNPEPIPEIENASTLFPYGWSEGKSCEEVYGEIVALTNELTSKANDDTSKARAIYQWVASNISYDNLAFSYREKQRLNKSLSEEESERANQAGDLFYTFNNRRGVCEGYAELSMLMLTIAGLPSAYISGFMQGTTEQGIENNEGRHAWNAVFADGKWIWFDATWRKWDMSSSFHKKIEDMYWYDGVLMGWPEYKDINEKVYEGNLIIPKTGKEIIGNRYLISSLLNPTVPTIPSYVERLSVVQNQQVEKLSLSNALTEVDISQCPALAEVNISGALTQLSIADCPSLTTLTMPNTLTQLGIYNCPGLTELIIPDSVTELTAIQNCVGLKQIVLGSGIKEIYAYTFSDDSSLAEVQLGEGLERIGDAAFRDCLALEQLSLPSSLKSINKSAFSGCKNLTSIMLPQRFVDLGLTQEGLINGTMGLLYEGGTTFLDYKAVVNPNKWWADSLNRMFTLRFADPNTPLALDGDHIISRLEFTQICTNLMEVALGRELAAADTATFSDTQDICVLKAYAANVIQGVSSNFFAPDAPLTREQAAVIFQRVLAYISENTTSKPFPRSRDVSVDQLRFQDRDSVSSWAVTPVYLMDNLGIMHGVEGNNFAPQVELTYGSAATMVIRYWDFLCDRELT